MKIAVGFDGTIVESKFPGIGEEKPNALFVLKKLAAEGNRIILWTSRSGRYLDDAVRWCKDRGLTFYAVNSNRPSRPDCIQDDESMDGSPKIVADVFIDSHGINGIPAWKEIYDIINIMRDHAHSLQYSHHHRRLL